MELKKVLLIHTGGTFGMRVDMASAQVSPSQDGYLGELFSYVPELKKLADLELHIQCNLDSSDMRPAVWQNIAEVIVERWNSFDGFVVIHGTDTMAYTASALSFFLTSLKKPVVLTGSQRPLSELRADARANIIDAVELATTGIPEVMICFDSKVHRGTRATKFSSEHMQAFRSHNSALLGHFGVHFNLNRQISKKIVPQLSRHSPVIDTRICPDIVVFDVVPGTPLSDGVIDAVLSSVKGIILRGFGSGNLPILAGQWLKLCDGALAHKIPVVMATQCSAGAVSLDAYANGRAFVERGVISAHDMSFESLSVKLMVMLGREIAFEKRQEFFDTPLAHEVFL